MARLSDLVRDEGTPPDPPDSSPPSMGQVEVSPLREAAPEPVLPAAPTPSSPPSPTPSADQTDWYRLAHDELTRIGEAVHGGALRTLGDLPRVALGIVESVSGSDRLMVQALSGPAGSQVITNSIHVSILAAKVGIGLGYERRDLERLTLAGLLHDVGMFTVPEPFLNKTERLTPSEREIIERHPEAGAELLHSLGSGYGWLAQVALQEHERWLGQGYPNKIKGPQIHPYAQVIGIVDVFDALVTPRPYRRRLLPHEAVRELLVAEKSTFSRDIMKTLVEQLSMYPLGTHVRLNSGEIGIVTELKPRYPLRPIVKLSPDAEKNPGATKLLDLSTTTLLHIVEVVKPMEVS